jgi:AcrR family transcriptional regulator
MEKLLLNNTKYNDICREGRKIIWKHGIKRVSIEEICREAGVSKMTFYKYFPNKLELVKSLFDILFDENHEKFNQIFHSDISFSQKLEELFHLKFSSMNSLSPELIRDIYIVPKWGLDEYLESKATVFKQSIVDFYIDSQEKGFIRKDVKIDFIMAYSSHIAKLLGDESLMAKYEKPQDMVMEMMNLLFYGIVDDHE